MPDYRADVLQSKLAAIGAARQAIADDADKAVADHNAVHPHEPPPEPVPAKTDPAPTPK
jgi:hypothetical protein